MADPWTREELDDLRRVARQSSAVCSVGRAVATIDTLLDLVERLAAELDLVLRQLPAAGGPCWRCDHRSCAALRAAAPWRKR